jgi:hypothetical protein
MYRKIQLRLIATTATKHGLSNKAEALEYLNTHQHEGKQILQDIVAQKYGGSFSNEVGADYNRLDKQIHNDLHKNMSNHYAEGKQNLNFSYNNTANAMDGKTQKVQSNVERQISENAQVIETARPDVTQIKSDEVAQQISLQKQKAQFDETSGTTFRTIGRVVENIVDPFVTVYEYIKPTSNKPKE